ncbi:MAG: [FeFe] hydrogenase H-cluster maturation GTPase HydF, partial [Selenomonadaceae bacterium]
MSLQDTPRANRLHIGLFGRRNSGKSSLVNALTNQQISLVSDVAGTTTDPVYKSMEIYGIGPCVFIDTAGYDDVGALGAMRVEKTRHAGEKTDIALIVCSGAELEEEIRWLEDFKASKTPVVLVLNKTDEHGSQTEQLADFIEKSTGLRPVPVSAKERTGIEQLRAAILAALPEDYEERTITGGLVEAGDTVLLVMPQDIQAPKGRLILPQVQTIRDLLDKKCIVISSTADKFEAALQAMKEPPALIITDSQVFPLVYDKKPAASRLTSFSVLFARYKGDV